MPNSNKWRLVLASQSPRRKDLLARTGVAFSVHVSGADEVSASIDPRLFALDIARLKGAAVASLLPREKTIIVSSDTVVAIGNKIYGKPKDKTEARAFLRELSGKTHQVHTGLVLTVEGTIFSHVESTAVTFAPISDYLLERYLASDDSLDKAGAYGIQGDALAFVSRIDGCYASVMGFPLARFCAMMEGEVSQRQGWDSPWQNYFS